MDTFLDHNHTFPILTLYLPKIHLNIVLKSLSWSTQWPFYKIPYLQNRVRILFLTQSTFPTHLYNLYLRNKLVH
jgi:hypothetical protein